MNIYTKTTAFYIISAAVIFLLNWASPNQQDGGLGFGGLAVIVFVLTLVVLAVMNLIKGSKDSRRYIVAGIHLFLLIVLAGKLFI
jgi:uncharacterized membrane protein